MKLIRILLFFIVSVAFAEESKKQINVKYINSEIIADGILDEEDWQLAEKSGDFYEHFPSNGNSAKYKTEIKVMNDDEYLYVGIKVKAKTADLMVSSLKRDFSAGDSDNITMMVVDRFSGLKAKSTSKQTIVEVFKKDRINKDLNENLDINNRLKNNNILRFY